MPARPATTAPPRPTAATPAVRPAATRSTTTTTRPPWPAPEETTATMVSDVRAQAQLQSSQHTDLSWLLTGLVQRVPHARSALLLSSDGLVKAAHGFDPDSADHMAAL